MISENNGQSFKQLLLEISRGVGCVASVSNRVIIILILVIIKNNN